MVAGRLGGDLFFEGAVGELGRFPYRAASHPAQRLTFGPFVEVASVMETDG
jgi:hypothetical protein